MWRCARATARAAVPPGPSALGMPPPALSALWEGVSENRLGAVAQVTAPDARTRHPWLREMERTVARLCRRGRNGAWSGRYMGF